MQQINHHNIEQQALTNLSQCEKKSSRLTTFLLLHHEEMMVIVKVVHTSLTKQAPFSYRAKPTTRKSVLHTKEE